MCSYVHSSNSVIYIYICIFFNMNFDIMMFVVGYLSSEVSTPVAVSTSNEVGWKDYFLFNEFSINTQPIN